MSTPLNDDLAAWVVWRWSLGMCAATACWRLRDHGGPCGMPTYQERPIVAQTGLHWPVPGDSFMPPGWCGGCDACGYGDAPLVCAVCSFPDNTEWWRPVSWPCDKVIVSLEDWKALSGNAQEKPPDPKAEG